MIVFVQTRMPSAWKQNLPTLNWTVWIRSNNLDSLLKATNEEKRRRKSVTEASELRFQTMAQLERLPSTSLPAPNNVRKHRKKPREAAKRAVASQPAHVKPQRKWNKGGRSGAFWRNLTTLILGGRGEGEFRMALALCRSAGYKRRKKRRRTRVIGGVWEGRTSTGPSVLWSRVWWGGRRPARPGRARTRWARPPAGCSSWTGRSSPARPGLRSLLLAPPAGQTEKSSYSSVEVSERGGGAEEAFYLGGVAPHVDAVLKAFLTLRL